MRQVLRCYLLINLKSQFKACLNLSRKPLVESSPALVRTVAKVCLIISLQLSVSVTFNFQSQGDSFGDVHYQRKSRDTTQDSPHLFLCALYIVHSPAELSWRGFEPVSFCASAT